MIQPTLFLLLLLTMPFLHRVNTLAAGSHPKSSKIVVIGAGASGMFAATAAADALRDIRNQSSNNNNNKKCQVIVLESGKRMMTKVSISGGGRCNVLHDTSKSIPTILSGYPRGSKELTGLYTSRFTPSDAKSWFEKRGVTLKTESDGRMFPTTDSSQTIIDTISDAATRAGVVVWKKHQVSAITKEEDSHHRFVITCNTPGNETMRLHCDSVILATGSSKLGRELAKGLGHELVSSVPSLFTLSSKSQVKKEGGVFHGLAGLSVNWVRLTLKVAVPNKKKKKSIIQEGPLLITHHGISGPATLRLSAFAAREFHQQHYACDVFINFVPNLVNSMNELEGLLWDQTTKTPKKRIASFCPFSDPEDDDDDDDGSSSSSSLLPKRLWSTLVTESGFNPSSSTWGEAPKTKLRALSRNLMEFALHVTSKNTYKDEFVTAGGIPLKEMNMKTMESKKCRGLFACGEVIDVDGVTGGYNFMNCWSTGFVAGRSAVEYVMEEEEEVGIE